jgi:hypothetical protein
MGTTERSPVSWPPLMRFRRDDWRMLDQQPCAALAARCFLSIFLRLSQSDCEYCDFFTIINETIVEHALK